MAFSEPESWKRLPAQFGDRVRIRPTAETEAAGIAGRTGEVLGTTTPSATGVQVVGSPAEDVALCVAVDDSDQQLWLDPGLVELVDHKEGSTITIKGVPKTWTRSASGAWEESPRRLPAGEWIPWLKRVVRRLTR